jgi:DUF1009 family protein
VTQNNNKLAIVAGNGELTTTLAKSAREQGFQTYAIAITDEARQRLDAVCTKVYSFAPGEVSKILECIKKELINQIVFIGKVSKINFLRNLHKLDWLAIKNLYRFRDFHDDSFHNAVSDFLKEHNINILPQTMFLKELFIEKEILSKRKPTIEERVDIQYGYDAAKKIAGLDIGQTVVVKNKMIVAIEAIEGTDEAIKRGCILSKSGVVVVKVAKPNQDERFDVPVIGIQTVEMLGKNGGGVLAFEAGKTIVADKEETANVADKYNICLIAI